VRNGIPTEKIVTCRHGLSSTASDEEGDPAPTRSAGPLRVAFFGRLHPTKGADVLIRAIQQLEGEAIELHLFGIEQPGDEAYASDLRRLAAGDPRVTFEQSVPAQLVVATLRRYDVLAVPSQWLETGPLVVLEAFAARTPVVGSNLGGVAELVRDNVDGLLVSHASVADWASALQRLARDRLLVSRLHDEVRPPRGMPAVCSDMLSIYGEAA
jgi:glycosyltransferase involved in cell wall biosynthesis